MPRQGVVARVERFDERVTILEELPGRVDALSTQISQLRDDMHREFSTVRDENERVMNHTRMLHEDLKADLTLIRAGQSSGPRRRRRPKS